jgi:aldehyde:ferredoxin oxidoreductase
MGTANFVDMSIMWGNLPNKYWSQARFEEATNLSGISMMETILTRAVPCYGCVVACGREVSLKDTPYGVEVVDGPEYETVGMLG